MNPALNQLNADYASATPPGVKRALVVDDSRGQRLVLVRQLQNWGYETIEACRGDDALDLCKSTAFDLIVSDWIMPGLSGPEFCRALRAMQPDNYSYFILLTSKNDKAAVAEGLETGADDFLSKPVSSLELHARIRAGERLLAMDRDLRISNVELRDTLQKLQHIHNAIDRDLQEARKLQQSLVRERSRDFGTVQVSFLLESSGHVGGDMVGAFPICENRIGVFSIDIAGHGVTAAMMCARISALFTEGAEGQNIALRPENQRSGDNPAYPPEHVAAMINRLLLNEIESDTYLTLAYVDIDLTTGNARLVQAGHPHPVLQRPQGAITFLGTGGMPVGLLAQASFSGVDLKLQPGDRLLIYSDGVSECPNPDAEELGQDRLAAFCRDAEQLHGVDFLDNIHRQLEIWSGQTTFTDDVSAVSIEFRDYAHPASVVSPRFYRGIPSAC